MSLQYRRYKTRMNFLNLSDRMKVIEESIKRIENKIDNLSLYTLPSWQRLYIGDGTVDNKKEEKKDGE